jgi:recombination protein RecR
MTGESVTLKKLAEQFASFPGIGRKSAWRLAFYVLTLNKEQIKIFTNTLLDAYESIHKCSICQNLTDLDVCEICSNQSRDHGMICVIEEPRDIVALEKSNSFNGLYHVLHGLISPLDGIGPNNLTIKHLLKRVNNNKIREVILATSPTIEGEATAMYISKLLKPMEIVVSRIAYGVPVGGELKYVDEVTISKAMENRNKL